MGVSIVSMSGLSQVLFTKNSSSESITVQKSSQSICGTNNYQQGVRFFI
jgi:hypothetical protein